MENKIFIDIQDEVNRNEERWGIQRHPFNLYDHYDHWDDVRHAEHYEIPSIDRAKQLTLLANKHGEINWGVILQEEVSEAILEKDPAKMRQELIQVCAVCIEMIKQYDRSVAPREKNLVINGMLFHYHENDDIYTTSKDAYNPFEHDTNLYRYHPVTQQLWVDEIGSMDLETQARVKIKTISSYRPEMDAEMLNHINHYDSEFSIKH